jgi:hypothetical protein
VKSTGAGPVAGGMRSSTLAIGRTLGAEYLLPAIVSPQGDACRCGPLGCARTSGDHVHRRFGGFVKQQARAIVGGAELDGMVALVSQPPCITTRGQEPLVWVEVTCPTPSTPGHAMGRIEPCLMT